LAAETTTQVEPPPSRESITPSLRGKRQGNIDENAPIGVMDFQWTSIAQGEVPANDAPGPPKSSANRQANDRVQIRAAQPGSQAQERTDSLRGSIRLQPVDALR
jgi:hypothetical protein